MFLNIVHFKRFFILIDISAVSKKSLLLFLYFLFCTFYTINVTPQKQ